MSEAEIIITPDPQILQVLSYLEMRPIDSLCELIDNAVDACRQGDQLTRAVIQISLPSRKEIEDGCAQLRVRDNGPGMTLEQVERSLRAGYSSKQRYGSLGLFGVGFNIATGKLGRVATLMTAREADDFATVVVVDLVSLRKSGNFRIKAERRAKPPGFTHGTLVDVSQPWGPGNQNFGFLGKLVAIGRPKTLTQLGRIYATLLASNQLRILVGDDEAKPFVHCVWSDERSVDHARHGQISAVERFTNKVIHSYVSCADCGTPFLSGEMKCPEPSCGGQSSITQQERISGWVGIQRYQDPSHFGLDLIRNGRAIRILEKSAFFEFQDPESGTTTLDYPIDNSEGRIVGEIHLDHVPVDPAKQNFERSSPEWRRAIEFLRGQSSLQPERPGAASNNSPVFRLYQGYRKVRGPGRRSMYMGKWLPGDEKPKLISKLEIDELLQKFDRREKGFFEDHEWWALVEQADQKPVAGLVKCAECFIEFPEGREQCPNCGLVVVGKNCLAVDCGQLIPASAVNCDKCGRSQIPEVERPWNCQVCGTTNGSSDVLCGACAHASGTPDPTSRDALITSSVLDEKISVDGLSIALSSGKSSAPIDLRVYKSASPIRAYDSSGQEARLPSVRHVANSIELFLDPTHPFFERAGHSIEIYVASEIAAYLYTNHMSEASRRPAEHSLGNITFQVIKKYWPSLLNSSDVGDELASLFQKIGQRLAESIGVQGEELYQNLSVEERTALASELIRRGVDIGEMSMLKKSGLFVSFLRPRGIMEVFKFIPGLFFDGCVWNVTYTPITELHPESGDQLQAQIKNEYLTLLEIAALYADKKPESPRETQLARTVCKLISSKLVV